MKIYNLRDKYIANEKAYMFAQFKLCKNCKTYGLFGDICFVCSPKAFTEGNGNLLRVIVSGGICAHLVIRSSMVPFCHYHCYISDTIKIQEVITKENEWDCERCQNIDNGIDRLWSCLTTWREETEMLSKYKRKFEYCESGECGECEVPDKN